MPSFSPNIEKTLYNAFDIAQQFSHEYITLEHLLLSLTYDEDAVEVMKACQVNITALQKELRTYIVHELTTLAIKENIQNTNKKNTEYPKQTSAFQRVILRAIIQVQSAGKSQVTGVHVLVSLFAETESFAYYFLQEQNMTKFDAVNFISHGIARNKSSEQTNKIKKENRDLQKKNEKKFKTKSNIPQKDVDADKDADQESLFPLILGTRSTKQTIDSATLSAMKMDKKPTDIFSSTSQESNINDTKEKGAKGTSSALYDVNMEVCSTQMRECQKIIETYCVNLNEMARKGKIDPLIGRAKEVERIVHVLCRRTKNNPLLVGSPGVGKTSIVEGMAQLIVHNEVPIPLQNLTVFSLDMGTLLAGTRYRGDFEERFKNLLKNLVEFKNAILFIDEIHTIVGAGAANGSSMDASNLLKPVLSAGQLRCIGSTTYQEFRQYIEKDRALVRRLQKIDVEEPNEEESIKILKGILPALEKFHQVSYRHDAIEVAVKLSLKYLHSRCLPDKAVDVLDEAGAAKRLKNHKKRKAYVSIKDIEDVITRMARIMPQTIEKSEESALKKLDKDLMNTVFGQVRAITVLVDSIRLARVGLKLPEHPVGCYLFCGPTGVGKTEIAKQLSKSLGIPLIRFDMSEYMERHSISRLIGSPPGYIGFEQGGLLTDFVDQEPHCVLLLDEIEKAHPDIFNILLQVMDYGKLTDHNGKKIDFQNVILIMTTNAGSSELSKTIPGFERKSNYSNNEDEIKRSFTPEFRNRLDEIVYFDPLNKEVMENIVNKFISQLGDQLKEKNITLKVKEDMKKWLIAKGFNSNMGARPLNKVIQESIKKPLSQAMLFGALAKGGNVTCSIKNVPQKVHDESDDENNNSEEVPHLTYEIPNALKISRVDSKIKEKNIEDKDAAVT